jgi:hypothetical protein
MVHGGWASACSPPPSSLSSNPELRRQWERLHSPEFLLEQTRRLSQDAARAIAARIEGA